MDTLNNDCVLLILRAVGGEDRVECAVVNKQMNRLIDEYRLPLIIRAVVHRHGVTEFANEYWLRFRHGGRYVHWRIKYTSKRGRSWYTIYAGVIEIWFMLNGAAEPGCVASYGPLFTYKKIDAEIIKYFWPDVSVLVALAEELPKLLWPLINAGKDSCVCDTWY